MDQLMAEHARTVDVVTGREAEKRAPVQGYLSRGHWLKPPGTIAWSEHLQAWEAYVIRFGYSRSEAQTPERIAERQGFGYAELRSLLGRDPITWRPVWRQV